MTVALENAVSDLFGSDGNGSGGANADQATSDPTGKTDAAGTADASNTIFSDIFKAVEVAVMVPIAFLGHAVSELFGSDGNGSGQGKGKDASGLNAVQEKTAMVYRKPSDEGSDGGGNNKDEKSSSNDSQVTVKSSSTIDTTAKEITDALREGTIDVAIVPIELSDVIMKDSSDMFEFLPLTHGEIRDLDCDVVASLFYATIEPQNLVFGAYDRIDTLKILLDSLFSRGGDAEKAVFDKLSDKDRKTADGESEADSHVSTSSHDKVEQAFVSLKGGVKEGGADLEEEHKDFTLFFGEVSDGIEEYYLNFEEDLMKRLFKECSPTSTSDDDGLGS